MGRYDKKSHDPLGSLLREIREMRGIGLQKTAEKFDYTTGHLSNVEQGITKPSLHLVRLYEHLFNFQIKQEILENYFKKELRKKNRRNNKHRGST